MKPYCFEIAAKDKTYFVSCKNDEELYSWMDEIYNVRIKKKTNIKRNKLKIKKKRSSVGTSGPTNFVHKVHVGFDPITGAFTVSLIINKPIYVHLLKSLFRAYPINGLVY